MISHHSALKGYKSIDLTLISIARGLSFYLAYLQTKKHRTTFSEYLFRTPLVEIIQSYNWDYECEFRLKDDPDHSKGAHKKIDYVLAYNQQVAGIEAKFVTGQNLTGKTINLSNDIKKLTNIFPEDKRIKGFPHKYGYILIAWEKSTINEIKMPDIKINKEIGEEQFFDKFNNKKNILEQWSSFSTNIDKPSLPFVVKVIKVF